jgi:hypothetical protein
MTNDDINTLMIALLVLAMVIFFLTYWAPRIGL